MFLHPRQIASLMARYPQIERYQFVITRQDHVDMLNCRIMIASGTSDPTRALQEAIPDSLKFRAGVEVVPEIAHDAPVVLDQRDWNS
jgi:phenylacetate-CoA ligase